MYFIYIAGLSICSIRPSWQIQLSRFCLPQPMQVAVFIGGQDGFGDGEVGFGFVVWGEVFLLVAGLGFQDDPLDVMGWEHGVGDRADLDGDVIAVLWNGGTVLSFNLNVFYAF